MLGDPGSLMMPGVMFRLKMDNEVGSPVFLFLFFGGPMILYVGPDSGVET